MRAPHDYNPRMTRSLTARLPLCLTLSMFLVGCGDDPPPPTETSTATGADETASAGVDAPYEAPTGTQPWFNEVTHQSGLGAFVQLNGDPQKLHITGPNGGGVALFDADGDGALDVFLTTGSRLGGFAEREEVPTNRLFLNRGEDLRFEDRTDGAGLHSAGAFGQGMAIADVDGDGRPDLFVANFGPNFFYRNRSQPGAPRFEQTAAELGLDDPRWASAGAFFDADRDGDLDLYVTHYIALDPKLLTEGVKDPIYSEWEGFRVMKGPQGLPAEADEFYRNVDGKFVAATEEVGMRQPRPAFGFQPISTDFDLDGDPDLFVSNDSSTNFLWQNQGDGTFRDSSMMTGVGFDGDGKNQSCMGVAHEDINGDGWPDIFITNFSNEYNILYQSVRKALYAERTVAAGLGGGRVLLGLGWGTNFFDADCDGDFDLYLANGHVYPAADKAGGGLSYAQPNFFYLHGTPGKFSDRSERSGPGLGVIRTSRGTAVGDLDGDGDLDLVVSNLDDHPTVLRNDTAAAGHAILIELHDPVGLNRSAIGAQIRVRHGDRSMLRERRSSSSFMGVSDSRLHFGLGTDQLEAVEITWPDGSKRQWTPPVTEDDEGEGPFVDCVLVFRKGEADVERRSLNRTESNE